MPRGSISGRVGQGRDDAVKQPRDHEACCSGGQRQRGALCPTAQHAADSAQAEQAIQVSSWTVQELP